MIILAGEESVYSKLCALYLKRAHTAIVDSESTAIYGMAEFLPCSGFDALLSCVACGGVILGEVGTIVPLDPCVKLQASVREKVGLLLQDVLQGAPRFVADKFSAENYLHFAAQISTEPCLLPLLLQVNDELFSILRDNVASVDLVDANYASGEYRGGSLFAENNLYYLRDGRKTQRIAGVTLRSGDFGSFLVALRFGVPVEVYLEEAHYRHDGIRHSTLLRFITSLGVSVTDAELQGSKPIIVNPRDSGVSTVLDMLTQKAKVAIEAVIGRADAAANAAVGTLGAILGMPSASAALVPEGAVTRPGRPRELVLGTVFDSNTHYDSCYYGDGAGLLYVKPDGQTDIYKGPARTWDGYKKIAGTITTLLMGNDSLDLSRSYLSIGCGAGSDVSAFKRLGWRACGVDLSVAAIEHGKRVYNLQDDLFVLNVLDEPTRIALLQEKGSFNLVASYDFLEHIWENEVDAIVKAMIEMLADGGVLFHVICTRFAHERDFVVEKGVKFTKENSCVLCSGHVNVRSWQYWQQKFVAISKKLSVNLVPYSSFSQLFNVIMAEDYELSQLRSWSPKNILVMKKGH